MKENQKIIDSFWDAVPDNATWEDLNKGIDVSFKYNNKQYSINTRLGNFYSMGIDGYIEWLHKKAIKVVKNMENEE
jgi:hypothetical protein